LKITILFPEETIQMRNNDERKNKYYYFYDEAQDIFEENSNKARDKLFETDDQLRKEKKILWKNYRNKLITILFGQ